MSKVILYYCMDKIEEDKLTGLCKEEQIQTRQLKNKDINCSIGSLAGIKCKMSSHKENAPKEYVIPPVMIISGFDDDSLDHLLAKCKEKKISPLIMKAIVTPNNVNWTLYELTAELIRERIAMMKK